MRKTLSLSTFLLQDKLEEQARKMKAETKQVETEYEARLRDSNIAYNTKDDEAADLKRENIDLMMKMGRKEEEIASLKQTVKQAQLHQRRCESKARKHEAEKEGLNEQIADLQEYIATLQAEHERLKSLKAREKTKEKEAANARGELEKKLSRRDKTIEALKVGASWSFAHTRWC
ncbi:uncharacterized protein LOC134788829 [Penaeus indicus]|uniref:uncharacterized protein LOC134788829 n=1 Tax=Penaeus indicus TaxID=29960 RepID=UPI00300CD0D7